MNNLEAYIEWFNRLTYLVATEICLVGVLGFVWGKPLLQDVYQAFPGTQSVGLCQNEFMLDLGLPEFFSVQFFPNVLLFFFYLFASQ